MTLHEKKFTLTILHLGLYNLYACTLVFETEERSKKVSNSTRMRGKAQRNDRPRDTSNLRSYSSLFVDQSIPAYVTIFAIYCSLQISFPFPIDDNLLHCEDI